MTIFYSLLLCLLACTPPADESEAPFVSWTAPGYRLPYDLDEPDESFKLSGKLDEISGLGRMADEEHLVAVQDELGIIFLLSRKTGKIKEKINFWKNGDYEGVEVVGSDIFVVKSSGTLYRVINAGKEDQRTEKYNSFLNQSNDVEGLAHDPANNRLLLACKAKAAEGKEYNLTKGLYGFDLNTLTLDSLPAFTISLDEVHAYLNTSPSIRKLEKLQEFFQPDESEFGFSPSGLAVHPITGEIFIISSVGKILMVLDSEGSILHLEKLKKKIHAQPEGICFDIDGTLYISNEGKNGSAKLHRFDPERE